MKLVFISIVTTPERSATPSSPGLRAAWAIATSSSVMVTPPWATPQEFSSSGRSSSAISASPCSKRSSSKPSRSTNGISTLNFIAESRLQAAMIAETPPSIGRTWPVMCLPACEANSSVAPLRSSSSPIRSSGAWPASAFGADALDRALGHLAREHAGRQRVDVDVVLAPFAGQGAGEVHHRRLAGVVGHHRHVGAVAGQAGDRGDVDDLAALPRDHAVLADRLAHQEDRADVEVHHLVPGLERVILGCRAPGGAGVVDEDVHLAETRHRVLRHPHDLARLAHVGSDPERLDAALLQMPGRFLEVAGLARGEQDAGAGLAERLGDLQAEAARAAGDERGLAGKVEQLANGGAHGTLLEMGTRGGAQASVRSDIRERT